MVNAISQSIRAEFQEDSAGRVAALLHIPIAVVARDLLQRRFGPCEEIVRCISDISGAPSPDASRSCIVTAYLRGELSGRHIRTGHPESISPPTDLSGGRFILREDQLFPIQMRHRIEEGSRRPSGVVHSGGYVGQINRVGPRPGDPISVVLLSIDECATLINRELGWVPAIAARAKPGRKGLLHENEYRAFAYGWVSKGHDAQIVQNDIVRALELHKERRGWDDGERSKFCEFAKEAVTHRDHIKAGLDAALDACD